jgi:hypothetical protein
VTAITVARKITEYAATIVAVTASDAMRADGGIDLSKLWGGGQNRDEEAPALLQPFR